MFFVLSGFLITGLLVAETGRTGRVGLRSFYARRARRILPAATLVLVAVVTYATVELSYRAVQRITTDAAWAAAFLSNVRFSQLGTDYFAEALPPSPLQHYWSLSVEEQFYLVWPPLLVLLLLVHRRRGSRSPWPLVGSVVGTLCLASLVWSVTLTRTDETAAYFSSLARGWELGLGALLALAVPLLKRLDPGARRLLGVTGLVAVTYAVLTFDATTPFPGFHALIPVLGTAALIAAGTGVDQGLGVSRLLSVRPLAWVGDLSYSIYLWHWPILVFGAAEFGEATTLKTAVLLGVILLLSVASYYLVENPVRHGGWFRAARWRGLILWPAAIAVVAVAVIGGRAISTYQLEQHLVETKKYESLRAERIPVSEELAVSLQLADRGAAVAYPLKNVDEVDELARNLWNFHYGCFAGHDRSAVRICAVGDRRADRTLVVLGDSHAGQWLPAFDRIGREHGYRVVPLIKLGCVPYDVPLVTDDLSRPYTECVEWRTWVLEKLRTIDPDVVYVSSRAMPGNLVASEAERGQVWRDGVDSMVTSLQETTPDVRLIGDTTRLEFDPIECLTDRDATMATCTDAENDLVREANEITRLAAEAAGAEYVDITPLVCLDQRCPAFAGGRMVFANTDHLSVDWVEHVLPELKRVEGALPTA